jgi:hypothetical protein
MTSMKTFYYCGASAYANLANLHRHHEASLTTTRPAQTILKSSATVSLENQTKPNGCEGCDAVDGYSVVTRSTKMKAGQK